MVGRGWDIVGAWQATGGVWWRVHRRVRWVPRLACPLVHEAPTHKVKTPAALGLLWGAVGVVSVPARPRLCGESKRLGTA